MTQNGTPDVISGQYIGGYTNLTIGKNSFLCVNIDHIDAGDHEAHATIFSGDTIYTTKFSFNWIRTSQLIDVHIDSITEYIRQADGNFKKSDINKQQHQTAELSIAWVEGLRLSWKTDSGQLLQSEGLAQRANEPSTLSATKTTWKDFKHLIEDLEETRYIFRGQSSPGKLRTSFHRTNRSNLSRYHKINIPQLQHLISSVHRNYFSISEISELISMLTLAQHHGYPTPILDWTISPYIAAYFAFLYTQIESKPGIVKPFSEHIRIYQFDLKEYQNDFPQFNEINDISLHVSFSVTSPLDNPRAIPQQSISCISTIDDIETYIEYLNKKNCKNYLSAYDIPISERAKALKDLELMGITHASLFPGLDGMCAYLKHKHFQ
ncbi:MAG: FRG domain-containing protein [Acidithiobacillus sp.]